MINRNSPDSVFCDAGYKSILHDGEQLCGDHVEIVPYGENNKVIVLADGLSSGVKASILSTLTSKILSSMFAAGLSLEECVDTITATLPVDSQKGVAYSTFAILRVVNNKKAELIQYDTPPVIFLRNGHSFNYPKKEYVINGKKIYITNMNLREKDTFVLMSDGCPNASTGITYNYNWDIREITKFVETYCNLGYTAKTLATMLVDECDRQYAYHPLDDATACVVRIRPRHTVNLMFGPPTSEERLAEAFADFFKSSGHHVISGGQISELASAYLGKPLKMIPHTAQNGIPPISELQGTDLVTDGIITMGQVLENARDYLGANTHYSEWGLGRDGASLVSRYLFEESTDVRIYFGKGYTKTYMENNLPNDFENNLRIIQELERDLKEMGKNVEMIYY